MRKTKLYLIGLFLISMMPFFVTAQMTTGTINGTISDSSGKALSDATVEAILNGKNLKKTYSDSMGIFNFKDLPSGNYDFNISIVGYLTQKFTGYNVAAGQTKDVQFTLTPTVKDMDAVIVVGYGTQKKVNLTGAIATLAGSDLNKRVAANPTQLLQGKLPGLSITQASGEAGNEGNVLRVRGLGTYSGAGSDPLVIVDGIPGSLSALNPESIESVTLLKDAASAAIYGSRAANGVILVTTKQGRSGKMQVSYSYNIGVTSATSMPDFVYNSVDYMTMYNTANTNSQGTFQFSQDQINAYANATDKKLYPDFNWVDAVFKTVNTQIHNINPDYALEKGKSKF